MAMMNETCPYCGKEMELGYIQSRDGVTCINVLRLQVKSPFSL
jgi:hypothetical protein